MTTARAKLLFPVLLLLLACGACNAILGITDVPPEASGGGDGGPDAASPTADGGADAHAFARDSGPDGGSDAATDANDSATPLEDSGPPDLSWAEWPMPNSPGEVADSGVPNLESYTIGSGASAGTVTDNVTKLIWQQAPPSDAGTDVAFDWTGAAAYCAALDLAGEQDWRLPTIIELVSIVDYDLVSPTLDTSAFVGDGKFYWSSTPFAGLSGDWAVNFGSGVTSTYDASSHYSARCVRGGGGPPFATPSDTPADHYETFGSGDTAVVLDTRTKLLWQQTPTSGSTQNPMMAQSAAAAFCASASLDGLPGRVPTVGELETLFDYNAISGAATDPTFFPTAQADRYWSSTPEAGTSNEAWGVPFDVGGTFIDSPSTPHCVRCVR